MQSAGKGFHELPRSLRRLAGGVCCPPLPKEHNSASACTTTVALHRSATKCMHYCYAADEHQHTLAAQDVQETDRGVQMLPKWDT